MEAGKGGYPAVGDTTERKDGIGTVPSDSPPMTIPCPLNLLALREAYRGRTTTPLAVVEGILETMRDHPDDGVFIHRVSDAALLAAGEQATRAWMRGEARPLTGVPFAVKDNIDVAGCPTTAACPAFTYQPDTSARSVQSLLELGALFVGKTNLDQFATGLVGLRTPYPAPRNPFDERYLPGGSSSGSAVAVARGWVSFAIGTDTAGSGRVPAAFNHIVGLKPTRGRVSTHGVVPACRQLDCVSVFALTVEDAEEIVDSITGVDPRDASSQPVDLLPAVGREAPRIAIPLEAQRRFTDDDSRVCFDRAWAECERLGFTVQAIDIGVALEMGRMLYEGPWVAQRLEATARLLEEHPEAFEPSILTILQGARKHTALAAYMAETERIVRRRQFEEVLRPFDALLVPSTPGVFQCEAVHAEPFEINAWLGTYTNFVNLLDLAGLAIPSGFGGDGLPRGVTLLGERGSDHRLARMGAMLHRRLAHHLGATAWPLPPDLSSLLAGDESVEARGFVDLVVVGAHLPGMPLEHELTTLGARFLGYTRTAACYRLFALPSTPPRPGLVRVEAGQAGFGIEVGVWRVTPEALGRFTQGIPSPLALGWVLLEDGSSRFGFLAEPWGIARALDVSAFGGWRAYARSRSTV